MKFSDILTEAFPYPPGSETPPGIIDYRDPLKAKGKYIRSKPDQRFPGIDSKRYYINKPRTHIVLTKNNGTIIYFYDHANTIDWRELLPILQKEIDNNLQSDTNGIVVHDTGFLIDRSRMFGTWSGDRNKYSSDLVSVAQALVDRGLATKSTPLWIGNWAANKGEHIGTVGSIISRTELPSRITLYHGTSNFRLQNILKDGLQPLPLEDRVWNKSSFDKKGSSCHG